MVPRVRPLIEVLAEIPDFRSPQGRRHPLSAILALACSAMLCGYRSYSAMAEWGHNYGADLVRALGFTRDQTPCAATLHNIFRQLDREAVEAKLGQWAESVLASEAPEAGPEEAVALDGKTLRGSRKQGAPGAHLLSAVTHRLGLTLRQRAVGDKTNEIPVARQLLSALVLSGRILTMDALLTQEQMASEITEGGGDYVMIVKGNQPQLHEQLQLLFGQPSGSLIPRPEAETVESGHGRIERRHITASLALQGYSDWPGLAQVFELERERIRKKTGEVQRETVYGVTSLSPARADAARLLSLTRGHWVIENRLHWIRDVTFDEDRSQVRAGSIPQVMAAFRNLTIGLLRAAGESNIAAACRRLAAQPWKALTLIGIKPKTE